MRFMRRGHVLAGGGVCVLVLHAWQQLLIVRRPERVSELHGVRSWDVRGVRLQRNYQRRVHCLSHGQVLMLWRDIMLQYRVHLFF